VRGEMILATTARRRAWQPGPAQEVRYEYGGCGRQVGSLYGGKLVRDIVSSGWARRTGRGRSKPKLVVNISARHMHVTQKTSRCFWAGASSRDASALPDGTLPASKRHHHRRASDDYELRILGRATEIRSSWLHDGIAMG